MTPIPEHEPIITHDVSWFLQCTCGWEPSPRWSAGTAWPLRSAHRDHIAEVTRSAQ